ncbi:hypothetical protein CDL12_01761 [Handroanthus impetiginosus]|uniref:Uncharacterized protein n=1 Tax=Handroanthus impetiginosus TaxID=429701 RepID=A0A2G9I6X1_9LAMI|nr:hypothetical protein CDL12_01761 [Handroanthus impetiginosus]
MHVILEPFSFFRVSSLALVKRAASFSPPMADSLDSNDGGAAEFYGSHVPTTIEAPSHWKQQSGDTVDASDHSGNSIKNAAYGPVQEDIFRGVVQESDVQDAGLANGQKAGVLEVEEQTTAEKQEEQVKCSAKCSLEVQVIEDTKLIDPSLLGNWEFNNDRKDAGKSNGKRQETEEKKEKKSKRRGGKARKNKEILNYYSNEKKEKKGLQYSRKELEALRFEKMEEQKKKWVEVYCGFGPLVSQEYDGLVNLDKIHPKDSVPSFDFDPRPQFLKSANMDPTSFPIGDEIECSVVEEECSEDDDSDEDYGIQKPAFFVTGEPNFDSGPPQDGLEYLRRVRWEAARVPKVAVAKFNNEIKEQSNYMPQIPDIAKCPENLLPLKQWEDSFLADFSELRLAFSKLDLQESSDAKTSIKLHLILEEDILDKFVSSTSTDDSCTLETNDANINPHSPENSNSTVNPPTLSTILKMDSAARTSMLKKRISAIENMSKLSHNESLWLFAVCAAVDCPLDGDTSAALRSLLRKCAVLRAAKTEVDDEVIILNILAAISGRYFGQLEK